jgi:5-methylcytosine-specific restriction endonuclease McrA
MKNFESKEPCLICGTCGDGLVCLHHTLTKKAHPEYRYSSWNLMPLCFFCHAKAHSMSLADFSFKYKNVAEWLIMNNWTWDEYFKSWDKPEV